MDMKFPVFSSDYFTQEALEFALEHEFGAQLYFIIKE